MTVVLLLRWQELAPDGTREGDYMTTFKFKSFFVRRNNTNTIFTEQEKCVNSVDIPCVYRPSSAVSL